MKIPRAISDLVESFEKLPGIGPKTAQRLSFYLLHVPQEELDSFAGALTALKKRTVLCSICKNVTERDPCSVCVEEGRDKSVIMVVEQPLDVLALERTSKYKGGYHVLHGSINPLENIGPDELYIDDLLTRIRKSDSQLKEIIVATNPNIEGDATAMYLSKKIKSLKEHLKISKLGIGIPTGADLEYADDITLKEAIEGRREI
jgi:recombination protein RecR